MIAIYIVAGIAVLMMGFLAYMKAPTDKAFVVTGFRKRYLIGKAGFRIRFFERKDVLSMELVSVPVATGETVPTNDFINIIAEAVANIKIGNTRDMLDKAAQHFLNKDPDDIATVARQVLEGNLREIIGQIDVKTLVIDRKAFSDSVADSAKKDLEAMGLEIVSMNVQNFRDEKGVLENLGVNNVAQISKTADIAKAEAQRDVAVKTAEANTLSNQARVESETAIAIQNTNLALKEAELKRQSDVARAIADNAYNIQMETSRRELEIQKAEANSAKIEKETEVQTRQVELTEKTLESSVKKTAEAERYRIEQAAEAELARQRAAAEATRYTLEQEAAGIEAKGKAEAVAIQAKAEAEAAGILKKAEAMKQMEGAAIVELIVKQLPDIVAAASKPLENVDSIVMYGDAQGSRLVGDVINSTSQIFEGLNKALGIDTRGLVAGFLGGKLAGIPGATSADSSKPTPPAATSTK